MPRIVIEFPENLKDFGTALVKLAEAVTSAIPSGHGGAAIDYGRVESIVAQGCAAVERSAHQGLLQSLDIDRPRVVIGGRLHTRVGRCSDTYQTMTGPVSVERSLYREDGRRNARVVDPVSLRAGVVKDGWLPTAARAMAHLLQQGTSREAERTARELGRVPYSRSSFEHVGHAVGELYLGVQAEVEDRLIQEYRVPEETASVSASLDRVSIPMEEPRRRPVGRPRKNAPKRPVERNFRMAYCGTVTLHDATGKALHTIRYGCMPQGDATGLAESLAADIDMLRQQRPDLLVALLQDGAPELWNLLDTAVNKDTIGTLVHRLIDFFHLIEKLHAAAVVIHGQRESAAIVKRWKIRLRNSSGAAQRILKELESSGYEHVRTGDSMPVHDAITYLTNNADRMDYAGALENGLPIGSGQIEATCKSLVSQRMKRAGSRWKERGGERILQLRALALSDRWESAMTHTLRPLRTAVRPAA